jgi:hypothetical protein
MTMNGKIHDESRSVRRGRAMLAATLAFGLLMTAASAQAARYWTPWVSEENGGPLTGCAAWNEAASGFGCRGAYCDDVRLQCETFNGGITLAGGNTTYMSEWFSEENSGICNTTTGCPNDASCKYGKQGSIDAMIPGTLSGVHCSGSNCDNLQLRCDMPVKTNSSGQNVQALTDSCRTVGPISEEQGSIDFGPNQYITSAVCTGKRCDNLTFRVCHFAAPF